MDGLPRLPQDLLRRGRLLDRLDRAAGLVSLRAPMGFGKTALAADWATAQAARGSTVIWMSGADTSGDRSGFWQALGDSCRRAGLDVSDAVLVDRPVAIAQALREHQANLVLVVDDYERSADDGVDRDLLELVERHPRLRVVVCLRAHRYFGHAARAGANVTIVSATEMLFTADETALLGKLNGVDLPAPVLAELHNLFKGWAAPLSAVMHTLRSEDDLAHVWATARRIATEFWQYQVEPGLEDEATLALMLSLSVPAVLTTAVADLITGTDKSSRLLRRLEQHGLLFADDAGDVYRFAPMAREVLNSQFEERYPEQLRDLHVRLARYHWSAGDPHSALEHAQRAEDWDLALDIVNSAWRPLYGRQGRALQQVLIQAPAAGFSDRPVAMMLRELVLGGGTAHQPALVQRTGPASAHVPTDGSATPAELEAGFLAMVVHRRRGEFDTACSLGAQLETAALRARHSADMDPALPAKLLLHIGITRQVAGDLAGARQPLRVALDMAGSCDAGFVAPNAAHNLALDAALGGDHAQALRWLASAPDPDSSVGWLTPHVRTSGWVARALLATDQLESVQAQAQLAKLTDDQLERDELWAFMLYARAQWALLWGDRPSMARELAERRAESAFRCPPSSAAASLLVAAQAELLIAAGRTPWARSLLDSVQVSSSVIDVARVRLALSSARPEHACRLVQKAIWQAETTRERAELLVLQARALVELGERLAALNSLRSAVDGGAREIPLRVWATVDRRVLVDLSDDLALLIPIIHALDAADTSPLPLASIEVVDLTERESLVLRHLGRGLTVGQVAKALYVSPNTIKTQVRAVYRKLGVSSRREAVQVARELGLSAGCLSAQGTGHV